MLSNNAERNCHHHVPQVFLIPCQGRYMFQVFLDFQFLYVI